MRLEWEDYKIVIWLGLIILLVILLDEWAFHAWKLYNPGHTFSHLQGKTLPLVDPNNPPASFG